MNARELKKLENEYNQLAKKCDNLTNFIFSNAFTKLSLYEKELLKQQSGCMRGYLYYLGKRVDLYNRIRENLENAENND